MTGIHNNVNGKPSFSVSQNYPNPITGLTAVGITMQKSGHVILEITSLSGQTVYTASADFLTPGSRTMTVDTRDLASGMYFYTVRAGNESITKKMIVE